MSKKLLSLLGILLLLVAIVFGVYTFKQRHENDELLKNPVPQTEIKNKTTSTPTNFFNKKRLSITDPTSAWVIVNKTRPLQPISYTPSDLVNITNGQTLRKEAADALVLLIDNAKSTGLNITAISGYRSYATQTTVYNKEVTTYGQTTADTESARPGHSEHQTGMAVDVGGGGCGIEDCFGITKEGIWLAGNAHKYGFIIRYTADKQMVTGYRAEPWHIRYIGLELAYEMEKQNATTLEEFFGLPNAPNYL